MPIIVGGAQTTPPPVRPPKPRNAFTATWVDPAGVSWPLSRSAGSRWWLTRDHKGIQSAVPIALTADDRARGGTVVRHIQPGPRLITLPLVINSSAYGRFYQDRRDLIDAITRTDADGPGWLVIARPDGTARKISAYYQDGFEENGLDPALYDKPVLTLYCPDAYWQDLEPTEVLRKGIPGGADFLSPYPTVSSSQTLGATTVTNPGERTYPIWTITGPASAVTATNNTVGQSWTLTPADATGSTLGAGEVVTVAGDPPTVTGPGTDPWWPAVDWAHSELWALERGDNAVDFTVSGGDATTSIAMSFARRWRSA